MMILVLCASFLIFGGAAGVGACLHRQQRIAREQRLLDTQHAENRFHIEWSDPGSDF